MSVFKLLAGAEAPTQLVPVIHVVEAAAALQSIVAACAEIATQTTHPHAITRRIWRRKTQPVEVSNIWEGITGLRISSSGAILMVLTGFVAPFAFGESLQQPSGGRHPDGELCLP